MRAVTLCSLSPMVRPGEHMDNGGCASGNGTGWSIITSSAANSQLAGVLAAVIFSGIVILFARRGSRSSQALGLFAATFVVLAFDSYLFGTVTGLTTDRFCERVWSEGMAAAGMLGVGGFALMAGISWLMADHADGTGDEPTASHDRRVLAALSRYMVLGVAAAVSLLLTMTSLDYLSIMYGGDRPRNLTIVAWTAPALVVLLTVSLTAGRRKLRKWWPDASAAPIVSWPFTLAASALLTYGIVGPVAAGWMMARPDSAWESAEQTTLVAVSLAVGLVLPGLLIVAVVLATPEIVPAAEDTGSQQTLPDPPGSPADGVGGVLQPLDRETLLQRSIEIFPQGYLMNISIIQGVALSVLTVETVNYLKRAGEQAVPQTVAMSLFGLAGLIIVSYEYLWFSTIMRWSPTFRDTAIPVILGVAEIVPPLLLGRTVAWWIASAVFALLGAGAFLNTASRLKPEMFPAHPASHRTVRQLLSRLATICVGTSILAIVIAILAGIGVGNTNALSTVGACFLALPGAISIIAFSEATLNNVYADFAVDRRPPIFDRFRGVVPGNTSADRQLSQVKDTRPIKRVRHHLSAPEPPETTVAHPDTQI